MAKQANSSFPKEEFRKEFVVNILIGFIVAEATILYFLGNINSLDFTVTAIPFISLYFTSKTGFYKHSLFWGVLLICVFSLTPLLTKDAGAFSTIIPVTLLMILIYSLMGTWHALIYLLVVILVIINLRDVVVFDKGSFGNISQYLFFPLTTGVALCVGWLPNQKIREALRKTVRTEHLVRMERDTLEIKLRERTESLFKLAELGIATKSMVHDISTPLNVLLMNIAQVTPNDVEKTQKAIARAQCGAQTMVNFVKEVRNRINGQNNKTWFEISKAVGITRNICETKNTKITCRCLGEVILYGNEPRFLQMIVNIVQNSVESYEGRKGTVWVKTRIIAEVLTITISDNGKGIDQELLNQLGSFTTKGDAILNGIGFRTAKDIAENDFNGTINTQSTKGKGTKTTIQIGTPIGVKSDRVLQPWPLPS